MLEVHHISCLVSDIKTARKNYQDIEFKNVSEIVKIESQKVFVCFVEIGKDNKLELVQPFEDNHSLIKMLNNKINYYHIAYSVNNIDSAIEKLCSKGAYLVNSFNSEAFKNNKCAFLYTKDMHLIELIQKEKQDAI